MHVQKSYSRGLEQGTLRPSYHDKFWFPARRPRETDVVPLPRTEQGRSKRSTLGCVKSPLRADPAGFTQPSAHRFDLPCRCCSRRREGGGCSRWTWSSSAGGRSWGCCCPCRPRWWRGSGARFNRQKLCLRFGLKNHLRFHFESATCLNYPFLREKNSVTYVCMYILLVNFKP